MKITMDNYAQAKFDAFSMFNDRWRPGQVQHHDHWLGHPGHHLGAAQKRQADRNRICAGESKDS